MNTDQLIAAFQEGSQLLYDQIRKIPQEIIHYKPTSEPWSIGEIIVHIGDAEAHNFIRAKKIIAETGGKVCVYNHQIWSEKLFYTEMDYMDALDMICILRKNLYSVLRRINKKAWKNHIYHPDSGKVTLRELIQLNVTHIDIHRRQVQNILDEWKTRNELKLEKTKT